MSDPTTSESEQLTPVVGVGASAGGVQAVQSLIGAIPEQQEYALVVIQHKRPESDQSLPTVFRQVTDVPVKTIENGDTVQTGKIYLNPARSAVQLQNNTFRLSPMDRNDPFYNPIDFFFESLSESRQQNSIGIVLSGTGTDGTLGLKKIKYRGGITLAQDTETAGYSDMPESARETVDVDFVGSTEEIAGRLEEINTHPYVRSSEVEPETAEFSGEQIEDILRMVYEETGHDLREYKMKPIKRRLRRQLAVRQFTSLEELRDYLEEDPARRVSLLRELLVDYTQFFRDKSTFNYLEDEFFPERFSEHPEDQSFRVWVPGCSTGEEVYSLVMVMKEVMDRIDTRLKLKVFATDIHPKSLAIAREGSYPKEIETDLKDKWVKQYFILKEGRYRVDSSIRDTVIFANHNVLQDPPYSRIDFLSCRNLLIYLSESQQSRVLEIFHYALRENGHLLLGSTESVDQQDELYTPENINQKIFRKVGSSDNLDHPVLDLTTLPDESDEGVPELESVSPQLVHRAEQRLIHQYGSPAVLLDETHEAIHVFGKNNRWLSYPSEVLNHDIREIVDNSLREELSGLLEDVAADGQDSSTQQLVNVDAEARTVRLTVEALRHDPEESLYYLIIFDELDPSGRSVLRADSEYEIDPDADEEQLRRELKSTRSHLQKTIEQLESKNKELRAKNRELQSLNEEYQSTNEELETSREELQSTNEELMTVNEKLKDKVESLDELNDDMRNLLRATRIPVIFLDRDLDIKWFTPSATEIFNLIESDVGRKLSDITSKLQDVDLIGTARQVLDTLKDVDFEAKSKDGRRFNIRLIPYREDQDVVGGVAITFIDVNELREAEKDIRILAEVFKNSNDAVVITDRDGTIEQWNRGAERLYGYTEQEASGMQIQELMPEDQRERMEALIANLLEKESIDAFRTKRQTQDGETLDIWLSASLVRDDFDDSPKVAFTERNLDWLPESSGRP